MLTEKRSDDNKGEAKLSTQMAVVIAAVIIAGAIILTSYLGGKAVPNPTLDDNSGNPDIEELLSNIRKITNKDHIRGSLDAPITIVEYSDLECPFCKQFHQTMNKVVADYPNEVLWVYRHFPLDSLHSKARAEAEAAECVAKLAGNEIFWKYVDKIFSVTPSNNGLGLSLLPKMAVELGVAEKDFTKCTSGDEIKTVVQVDVENAVTSGGEGTPFSILITPKGEYLNLGGAVPFDDLKQLIDESLADR